MKKIVCVSVALLCVLSMAACGSEPATGDLTLTAPARDGHEAALAMDGDVLKGWVGKNRASEDFPRTFDIDFGKRTTFSRITLDDSFTDGYTNKKPAYVRQNITLARNAYDATSIAGGTSVPNLFRGEADGQNWASAEIPTEEAPQFVYFTMSGACSVQRLVLDNAMNSSVMTHFAIYTSENAVQSDRLLPESYTLLQEVEDNTQKTFELNLEAPVTVKSMLLAVYGQKQQDEDAVAMLDEIFFYAVTPEDYTEPHYPVRFFLMGSNDGETYETFVEEYGNAEAVWVKELEKSVTYRYVRYLLFEENGNNYPSIGEIKFE